MKKKKSNFKAAKTAAGRRRQQAAIKQYYATKNKANVHIKAPYPHFRYYLKSKHPALITGEYSPSEYQYRKVSHSEREGRHLNQKVFPNPNPRDPDPMYIVKRVRKAPMKDFEPLPLPWKYKKEK